MQYFALPAAAHFPVFQGVLSHPETPGLLHVASRLLSPTLISTRVPRRLYNLAADLLRHPHPALIGAMAAMNLPVGTHWIEVEDAAVGGRRHAATAEVSADGRVSCMGFALQKNRSVLASPCVATRRSDTHNAAMAPCLAMVERDGHPTGPVEPIQAMNWFRRSVRCEVPELLYEIFYKQLTLLPPVASRAEAAAAMQALALVAVVFASEFADLRTDEPPLA